MVLRVQSKGRLKTFVQIGWREWFKIPDYKVDRIKVKIDTGAKTSALHVSELKYVRRNKKQYVRFVIHPLQRKSKPAIKSLAELIEHRMVKSSNGVSARRPVVKMNIQLGEHTWPIEVTLTNRDEMGFRMLLGRNGIPKKFLVNPHKSFIFWKSARRKPRKSI